MSIIKQIAVYNGSDWVTHDIGGNSNNIIYGDSSSNLTNTISSLSQNLTGISDIVGSTNISGIGDGTLTGAIAEHEQDITALNDSLLSETNKSISLSLHNCTGSISGALYASVSKNHNTMSIMGRVRITSFARTGSNPGVLARLPYIPKFSDSGVVIGFRGESPVENVTLNYSEDDPLARITTTESYSNASGSTLTLMIPIAIFIVKG